MADDSGNYTFTPIAPLSEGSHSVTATAADAAGNSITSTQTNFAVDTTAPSSVTIAVMDDVAPVTGIVANNGSTDDTMPTFNGTTEAGATVTIADGETVLGTTTADANGHYTFTPDTPLSVGSHSVNATATDAAGNSTTSTSTAFTVEPPAVIDLGPGNGQLIDPVYVDGNYYYYWDKDGDGLGMVNGNPDKGDQFTHNELDAIFKYDENGNLRPGTLHDTDNNYRYADVNGYNLALPTDGIANSEGPHNGTAIDNVPAGEYNPTYDDLLAIWDAFNGSGTGQLTSGVPAGWAEGIYWASTPYQTTGHSAIDLLSGQGVPNAETNESWVAVQVIF